MFISGFSTSRCRAAAAMYVTPQQPTTHRIMTLLEYLW
jgi:hypothetical protein